MAQLTVAQCKDYLKIQGTAEDTPLGVWLASAIALVEAEIGRPIATMERTFVIEAPVSCSWAPKLLVPMYPIAVADSSAETEDLELVDGDSATLVEDTDYRLDLRSGIILPAEGSSGFSNFPYTVTCHVGLEVLEEYSRIEPVINAAILDVVADRYQRRNPASTNEASGGDVSTAFTTFAPGLPQRVQDMLAPWRISHLARL